MHFTKSLISLFAISSFANARLARREIAEVAYEDYIVARDEYIEKRDLFRRLGATGNCNKDGRGGMRCMRYEGKGVMVHCGSCRRQASTGEGCLCNKDEKDEKEKKKKEKEEEEKKKKEKEKENEKVNAQKKKKTINH
ncbi:unnamed protein product [Clonostachys rosea]|uniref:Invertebrate defensins family profile domain-containing protein n=1 Tax=Bionectria ochroleuca TaxID=29856 RepID=A0ABY6V0Y9_BIOOC|nr:unnamed protein product [Clonostachys rosea]